MAVEMTEETVRSAPQKNDRKTTINQKLTMADTSVLVFLLFLVLPARRPSKIMFDCRVVVSPVDCCRERSSKTVRLAHREERSASNNKPVTHHGRAK
jgi:hypothetical protein